MSNVRVIFIALFSFSILALGAPAALAQAEVACISGDCLKHGWILRDRASSYWSETRCLGEDCDRNGWSVRDARGVQLRADCVGQSCFTGGWTELVSNGQRQDVRCNSGSKAPGMPTVTSCLDFGWIIYGPFGQHWIQCLNGSCRHEGWMARVPGQRDRFAQCRWGVDSSTGAKIKDCFRFGWHLTTY